MNWQEATQNGEVVIRGALSGNSALNVLLALSLSRQFTGVELHINPERPEGRVFLKAGQVLAAEVANQDLHGLDAFRHLMAQPLKSYTVYRFPAPEPYPEPLARLGSSLVGGAGGTPKPASSPTPAATRTTAAPTLTTPARATGTSVTSTPRPTPVATPNAAKSSPTAPTVTATPSPTSSATRSTSAPATPVVSLTSSAPMLAIASPKGGCGKTTVALNLSVGLAKRGLNVVLVDGDPNGDVLSTLAGRARAKVGVYDVLYGKAELSGAVLRTVVPNLRIVPALGEGTSLSELNQPPPMTKWRALHAELARSADVVVVDTPAGMFGLSAPILLAAKAVVGVLQAENVAQRSFDMFDLGMKDIAPSTEVLGVVLNMVNAADASSLEIARSMRDKLATKAFATELPRDTAFNAAAGAGRPIAAQTGDARLAALFQSLAEEVHRRIGGADVPDSEGSFLL